MRNTGKCAGNGYHSASLPFTTVFCFPRQSNNDVIAQDAWHGAEFDAYLSHPEIQDDNAIEAYDEIWMRVAMPIEAYTKLMYKSL